MKRYGEKKEFVEHLIVRFLKIRENVSETLKTLTSLLIEYL